MYRSEIDGLRAIAVMPVVLFHAGLAGFDGRFVGVDIFFVISGYLITTILINDIESNCFSFLNFYVRRARRILPALFLVTTVCIPFAWFLMLPGQFKDFSQSLVAVSLFLSNVLFWLESGYFDTVAEFKPLLHTWSLSVEEQFYLIFPLFLTVAWRFGKNKAFILILVLSICSLLLSELLSRTSVSANYYLMPTRVWELFAGSITAFTIQRYGVIKNNICSLFGITLIIISVITFDKHTPFPSLFTLIPVFGSVMVILFARHDTIVAKILSTKLLVGVGLISYSIYLWHQPVFAFTKLRYETISPLGILTLFLTISLLAIFTYEYVEKPFRSKIIPNRAIYVFSISGIIVLASLGLFFSNMAFKLHPMAEIYRATERNMYETMKVDDCKSWFDIRKEANSVEVFECENGHNSTVLLLGGSHALNLHNIFYDLNQEFNLKTFASGGCRFTDMRYAHCAQLYDQFQAEVQKIKERDVIIYHQAFNQFIVNLDDTPMYYDYTKFQSDEYKISEELIEKVFTHLNALSENAERTVVWLGPFPEVRNKNLISWNKFSKHYFEEFNTVASMLSKRFVNVRYVPFQQVFKFDFYNNSPLYDDCLIYQDSNHLSDCGEKLIARSIAAPILQTFSK